MTTTVLKTRLFNEYIKDMYKTSQQYNLNTEQGVGEFVKKVISVYEEIQTPERNELDKKI